MDTRPRLKSKRVAKLNAVDIFKQLKAFYLPLRRALNIRWHQKSATMATWSKKDLNSDDIVTVAQTAGFRGVTTAGAIGFIKRGAIPRPTADACLVYISKNPDLKRCVAAYTVNSYRILNTHRKIKGGTGAKWTLGCWRATVRRKMKLAWPDEQSANSDFFKLTFADMYDILQAGILKAPRSTQPFKLYRGQGDTMPWAADIAVGDVLLTETILSTSLYPATWYIGKENPSHWCCLFVFHVPAGFPVLFTPVEEEEAPEILLPGETTVTLLRIMENSVLQNKSRKGHTVTTYHFQVEKRNTRTPTRGRRSPR